MTRTIAVTIAEGRGRKDDHHRQSRRRMGERRPARAVHRSRSPVRAHPRLRPRPLTVPRHNTRDDARQRPRGAGRRRRRRSRRDRSCPHAASCATSSSRSRPRRCAKPYLARALAAVVDDYDLIVIDCPPNLGLLTVNALFAAAEAIVPVSMLDSGALQGAGEVQATIATLAERDVPIRVGSLVRTNGRPAPPGLPRPRRGPRDPRRAHRHHRDPAARRVSERHRHRHPTRRRPALQRRRARLRRLALELAASTVGAAS